MKKQLHHLSAAVLAALAMTLASQASHAAALDNAGFETGLSGWTTAGSVIAQTGDVHTGSLAAVLADDASSLTAALASAVQVSAVSSFGFWGRSDAGLLSLVVLNYSDGTNSSADVSIFDLGNSGWTYYDLGSSLAAGKTLTGFTLYGSSASASFIDDVTLTTVAAAVPEPAPSALMLAGVAVLGGLTWRRRRR